MKREESEETLVMNATKNGLTMEQLNRYENMLETVGNTPLVRLNYLSEYTSAKVYAKLESFNPGLASKDRIVKYMVEKAESESKIKPGGTFIEATSGNTGYALASICAMKGYNCILTMKDKISKSKVDLIKAFGAQVYICPSNVKPNDPKSYFSVAQRLNEEIDNSYYLNQNHDTANMDAHFLSTGPEIWEQTEGNITHFIACASTGGTVSGCGRFLKTKNPDINVIGVDAVGSYLKPYHETGKIDETVQGSTELEGVGKKIIPSNVDFDTIDRFITVKDKESALSIYELARKGGLLMGYSSGAAIEGVKAIANELTEDDIVVLLLADHGSKYLTKIYDPEWMKKKGFWDESLENVQNNNVPSSMNS